LKERENKMVKNHMKRLSAPRSWPIPRKVNRYVARPNPGWHSLETGMPLVIYLRDILKLAGTRKDVRDILYHKGVLVNGRKVLDHKMMVGLFDIIEFPLLKKSYLVSLTNKGKLTLVETSDKDKLARISSKRSVKGKKFMLGLYDGRSLLTGSNEHKVGDSIVIELPSQKIKGHLKLEKGAYIFLTGGKHIGESGTVEDIKDNKIIYKGDSGELTETLKAYAYVIGKDKPLIKIK